jgi:hypothetical protein
LTDIFFMQSVKKGPGLGIFAKKVLCRIPVINQDL